VSLCSLARKIIQKLLDEILMMVNDVTDGVKCGYAKCEA